MRDFRIIRRLLSCACVVVLAAAAAEAKAWRRIVPLRSTRAQVERRLGKPNPRNLHYEFRAERAFIIYSSGEDCAQGSGGGWDVPRDTVVSIVVTPKKRLQFSALQLDLTKFKKAADPETPAHTLYTNEEEGLTYRVFEGEGEYQGRILKIQFDPAAKDGHRRCPDERQPTPAPQ